MAYSATTVLPLPTSPCSNRFIGHLPPHVARDLADRLLLVIRQLEGKQPPDAGVDLGGGRQQPVPGSTAADSIAAGPTPIAGPAIPDRRIAAELARRPPDWSADGSVAVLRRPAADHAREKGRGKNLFDLVGKLIHDVPHDVSQLDWVSPSVAG